MAFARNYLRRGYNRIEALIGRVCGAEFNPLQHLGSLGFFSYWIVAVTGVYLYFGYETSVSGAFQSVEYLTTDQWYLGGVMRSLHRYASDAMVAFMFLHMLREFALGRFRGARAFSWITGVPVIWLVYASGITGYWLVWDKLAQYVAITTSELLDWLPLFGTAIARNFLAPDALEDRFFTLLVFMHIFLPLLLLLVMWIHVQRITKPEVNPPKRMAVAMLTMFLLLSLAAPATSHDAADLSQATAALKLDWYYLGLYPLIDVIPAGFIWAAAAGLTIFLCGAPFLGRRPARDVARVSLEFCNGCEWCLHDCPYAAISMAPRTDGRPFERQASVNRELCVGCGVCAGACPTSTPFRAGEHLVPGIELQIHTLRAVRAEVEERAAALQTRTRIVVFGCAHADAIQSDKLSEVAVIALPCAAMLPPSFIDYVLAKKLAEGVVVTGCRIDQCINRTGARHLAMRLNRKRDPRLRGRVEETHLAVCWAGDGGGDELAKTIAEFAARLEPEQTEAKRKEKEASLQTQKRGAG